ncbi:zinc-ribbon domain-containing protein [uncultured Methanobrevibacter sp.]|uniref:zinc-ribbon domain-containing protein n=1 Tax=uncultured Methanobrevibacter sp. TaxID=253161 RepID=UPI002615A05E
MSKFCDKCGNEIIDENIKFCDKCGAKVQTIHNKNNSEIFGGVACKNCGTINPIGQEFCSNCGRRGVEDNKTAVILGYVFLYLTNILSFITGIYLVTRENSESKTQGILLIAFSFLNAIIGLIFGSSSLDIGVFSLLIATIIETVIGYGIWSGKIR